MKKKKFMVIFLVAIFGFGVFANRLLFSSNTVKDGFNDLNQVKHENMLSMMLETDNGSGEYSLESRSTWPSKDDGYIFNSTLSKCEKGSKLRWDDENNAVVMVGVTSDKCYVYFDVYEPLVTLADYVKSLYTGTQGENNLYYHDENLTNGAGDNSYRYAGSSSTTNNYVCFGSTEETCPDDNLYRIIGVFGDQVKLIKWDYATSALLGTNGDYSRMCSETEYCVIGINKGYYKGSNSTNLGAYFWNYDYTNIWSASKLNTLNLNTNFLNNIGMTWRNKVSTILWKVGGNSYDNIQNVIATNAYKNEFTNPIEDTTYEAKIGLMYTSDYGFAASPSAWTLNLTSYESVTNSNWMYMGVMEWTIVRQADNNFSAFSISSVGNVSTEQVSYSGTASVVRPVFYLNSDVEYDMGTGSKNDPIRIKID